MFQLVIVCGLCSPEHDRSVSDKEMTEVTARKNPLTKKIYGLKPDTPYIISIQAYTDIGPGNEYRIEERSLSASGIYSNVSLLPIYSFSNVSRLLLILKLSTVSICPDYIIYLFF